MGLAAQARFARSERSPSLGRELPASMACATASGALAALLHELAPGGGISDRQWARLRLLTDRDGVLDHALECVDRRLVTQYVAPSGRTVFVVASSRPASGTAGTRAASPAASAPSSGTGAGSAQRYVVLPGFCSCVVLRDWAGATAAAAPAGGAWQAVRAALASADDRDSAFDATCKHELAVAIARALSPAAGAGGESARLRGGDGAWGARAAVAAVGGGGATAAGMIGAGAIAGEGGGDDDVEALLAGGRSLGAIHHGVASWGSTAGHSPALAIASGSGVGSAKYRVCHVSDAEMAALLLLPAPLPAPPPPPADIAAAAGTGFIGVAPRGGPAPLPSLGNTIAR